MDLNLPTLNQLSNCKNLLIAGMGGGFDVFCGLNSKNMGSMLIWQTLVFQTSKMWILEFV